MEEASYLMDRPVGGWSELVTNHTLDLKLDAVKQGVLAEMHRELGAMHRELRSQTWKLMTAMIAGMGAILAALVTVSGS